ncbi:FAD-dependent oxidoreductase [Colwellia sp. 1_MG-2023]|uniref:NAD(P)/FAD-dependent oxidoreductase n=1 Tax=unclassified Colwellia TaxID=196834 RepID=UPI001C09716B|nr:MULTISPECIES: FAD-dependent oxidoreductase [unclassified Colwellia]MBU2925879.1 FAD-dependent oxidoreductase [Colwellia sp. C2M11]MDO6489159.1 FAD-dependent oxidoreductase [Colwellia sp. 6_MG-2023]MDO6652723.1 FAD-dependent oxidoreductase [Colwellia sp. 3_MG-2023]MDO6665598.1 FAD-dependent oxidoreductase [Colwellia sp. 2_MG-2023]MDO6689971.1 FAD-dependent oxidoreductase [Colwellia sp. 1_MG-2023]
MKHIAIIGSGISGLTAAYLLSKKNHVTVFEKNDRIGGHTATVDIEKNGQSFAIDTGFIVFNDKTYPNFLALLSEIGIGKQATQMSFSVHNCQTGMEYNGHNLNTLFAQRRNLFRPKFWGLVTEILRFNKQCKAIFDSQSYQDGMTLGQFLTENNFSDFFAEHYILPMGAAIWSSSLSQMEDFEFRFFVQFFHNHGLLNIADRPQWYVIPKGSRSYLKPLCQPFENNIKLNADISGISRSDNKVHLHFNQNPSESFDDVVVACHSDEALALLNDATEDETAILSAMPYSENSVILHTDKTLLPKREKAWASWNYQLSQDRSKAASVTYNMNILQGIESENTFCVTLNQKEDIDPNLILREFTYHHPIFSSESIQAQQQRDKICGINQTHFAGAYWHSGFHEDGVRSAIEVAKRFGCSLEQ